MVGCRVSQRTYTPIERSLVIHAMTEEEQLRAAIEASMQDQIASEDAPEPAGGADSTTGVPNSAVAAVEAHQEV